MALNTLQTNFAVVDAIRNSGQGANKNSIPEMVDWCRRIGYEVRTSTDTTSEPFRKRSQTEPEDSPPISTG